MSSSIKTYVKIIREMINRYGIDPSVDQLNEFIAYKCKKRQAFTVQASIKHYIKFRWRNWNSIESQLVKAKARPVAKKKNFLKKEQAIDVIHSIKKPEYKLIAKIQYFTGARVSEVISIKKSSIIHEKPEKRLRMNIVGKGDKVNPIYISDSILLEMQSLLMKSSAYLFIRDEGRILSEDELMVKVENYYKRYHKDLKDAARDCNLDVSTHDWRRCFAQSLRDNKVDTYDIKKALRHERIETTERYFKDESESIAKIMLKHQQGI